MNSEVKIYQDDEIDLRELWEIIVNYKMLIVFITGVISFVALIYVFVQKPIYEVKAILEIGTYNGSSLEDPSLLVKKLEVMHVFNKDSLEESYLDKVSLAKGSKNLIEISVLSLSNEEGRKKINMIIDEIYIKHQKILDAYLLTMQTKIENLERQRYELMNEKEFLSDFISKKTERIDLILKENPAVAAVYTVELNNKSIELSSLKDKIYTINNQLSDLYLAMSANNVKSTAIIDDIIVSKHPIKPKKSLIVTVAFVIGLILSIFIVFLIAFVRKPHDI